MHKKALLFLSTLALNCQTEEVRVLENISIPKIEVTIPDIKEPKKLEEKIGPKDTLCTIDISNKFIPELLSLSRDAQQYFSKEGSLRNPFQRERFGIFSSFAHHQKPFEHYAKAIERRGDQEQPKIELTFVPYTTEKTFKKISALEQQLQDEKVQEKQKEKIKQELETLQKQVQEVKDIQQILQWEDYYKGEITGLYDAKTSNAVMRYQKRHQERLINPYFLIDGKLYLLEADGSINKPTRELLNKSFEEYALGGVRRVLEERVFHAKCNNRYPYVIEQQELHKLVSSAAEQLNLHTIEGVQEFLSAKHETATVYLDIPERYQQESMKLEVEVEKWEKNRTKSKLRLYSIEEDERIELFQTRVVVGGKIKNKKTGKRIEKNTPEGKLYLKNILLMPLWNPKEEVQQQEEVKEEEMLSGPFNAFGMILAPLYKTDKPQKKPFSSIQDGYDGYGIHLTAWPSSIETIGASHGCIRIHPDKSMFFYFLAEYTPHKVILEDFEGRETVKYIPLRGSSVPFEPEHYIKVLICEKRCGETNVQSHTL